VFLSQHDCATSTTTGMYLGRATGALTVLEQSLLLPVASITARCHSLGAGCSFVYTLLHP
jgi:hypothetical protein